MKNIITQFLPPPSQFIRVVLVIFFSFFLFQCKDKRLFDEVLSSSKNKKFVVTVEKAKNVSTNFSNYLNAEKLTNKNAKISNDNPNENKEIRGIDLKKDQNGNTLMFIIKYKNKSKINKGGGYLVVSGDMRVEPILAFSEEDDYDVTNPGLESVLNDYGTQISKIKNTDKEPTEKIKWNWERYEKQQKARNSAVLDCQPWYPNYPNCCPPNYTTEYIFLTTHWSQSWPYNANCVPRACGSAGFGNAGCGAIAISQVLNYYTIPAVKTLFGITGPNKPNLNIGYPFDDVSHWTTFGNNNTLNQIGKDRATLIRTTGDFAQSFFGPGSTCPTVTWRNNIFQPFYLSGYSNSGNRQVYNQSTVGMELKQRRPVIMDGTTSGFWQWGSGTFENWHIWVLDGYRESFYSNISNGYCNSYSNAWYHHNWGWGNAGTWCTPSNIIDEDNTIYNSYLNATTGIRP